MADMVVSLIRMIRFQECIAVMEGMVAKQWMVFVPMEEMVAMAMQPTDFVVLTEA
jgi:hypothetical protein